MPTYEYKCDACGKTFEKFQPMTAAPIKKCPTCGKNKVRRLISTGAGLIFKGGGFYITDYRSEGYKTAAKNDAGGDAKPAETKSSDSKPSEAAPAAKTIEAPAAKPAQAATPKTKKQ